MNRVVLVLPAESTPHAFQPRPEREAVCDEPMHMKRVERSADGPAGVRSVRAIRFVGQIQNRHLVPLKVRFKLRNLILELASPQIQQNSLGEPVGIANSPRRL